MSKTKNKNLTIKILALFISILLWSYVRSEINPETIREFKGVNVEIMNERVLNDSDLIIVEPKEIKISVKVSGRRSDVNSINREDITAQIDLSEATRGTKKILIDVNVPFKVNLYDISERYASIEIDSMITVKREVELNIVGDGKDNTIKNSTISPQNVEVSGPSTLIDKISKVIVNIDMDKISSNGIMKLPIKVIDKDGNEIKQVRTNIDMVEISLSLLKTKQVIIKPKVIGNVDKDYKIKSINTNPKTVTIRGLEEDLKGIDEIETEDIDIMNIDKDKRVNINLKLPDRVEVEEGKERIIVDITVTNIKLEETPTATELEKEILVPLEQISLENIINGFKVNFVDHLNIEGISVKLKGQKEDLETVNSENLKLILDLNELEEGTHNVELLVTPLDNIEIESVNPKNIKINIESIDNIE